MKSQPPISKSVWTILAACTALVILVIWIDWRQHEKPQPEIPAQPKPEATATTPDSTTPAAIPAITQAKDGLPPVVPIPLTNVLIEAENGLWLRDTNYLLVPHRPQVFGGVEFLMDGLIQLQGRISKEYRNCNYRNAVIIPLTQTNIVDGNFEIIQRGSNVASLHLLGGTHYGSDQDQKFAEVVWDYADGTTRRTSLVHLNHLRNWTRYPYEQPAHLPYTFAKVVWTVPFPAQPARALRLYHVTFANPEPKKTVCQLELVSTMEDPTLFVVGLTLDPLTPGERADGTPDLEPTDPNPAGQIQVSVQTSDGQPVPQAKLQVQFQQHSGTKQYDTTVILNTDAGGSVPVGYPPQDLDRMEVNATHEEYGSRKMVWDLKAGDIVPATYTLKLGAVVNIGGTVVDDKENPIADAKISLHRFWTGGEEMNQKGEQADFPSQTVSTDGSGQWQAKGLPVELLDHIGFDVKHPDFMGTNITVGANDTVKVQLRAGTLKTVLRRGTEVRGLVTDDYDNPVPGATVWAGKKFHRDRQETKTDAQGRFTFRNVNAGDVLFSVLAKSRNPDSKTINVHSGMKEIIFRLKAGSVIQAHVQDELGQPVSGARVMLEGRPGETTYDVYEFSANTDNQGNFVWDGTPDEPVPFSIFHDGYEAKRGVKLVPHQDNTVTLRHSRQLHGLVLDADTSQPVTKFSIRTGHRPDENSENIYGVIRDQAFSAPDGRFTMKLDEEDDNAVAVSSDDYAFAVQSFPEAQNGIVQVTVRLKSSAALHGVVTSPDGTPLPGVNVAVVKGGPGGNVSLQHGHLRSWDPQTKVAITEAEGRFSVGSPPEGGTVVAAGDFGFASAPIDQVHASGIIVLQPFGRIEGIMKIAGEPAAGKDLMVDLSIPGVSTDWDSFKTTTDDQGAFNFDKVPPGEVTIVRLIQTSSNSWTHSYGKAVVVEPGKTTQVSLGDSGAVLKGTVRYETPPVGGENLNLAGRLSSQMPAMPSFNSAEEAQAFYNSTDWKELMKQQKNFAVTICADGTFMIDSVPSGTYSLNISASKSSSQPWTQRPVAQGQTTVTVPDSANPLSPINIGDIVLKSVPTQ
jgi:uncharacterized GH25 family protein